VNGSRDEFRQLAERYAAAIDGADPAALADLFAPDGVLVIRAASGRKLSEFRGDRLRRFVALLGETYASTLHHVTTQLVDLDAGTGTTWCLAQHVTRERTLESVGVRYQDAFAQAGGEWRFAARDVTALWVKVDPLPRVGLAIDRAVQEELA
jgi:hypothetical protein